LFSKLEEFASNTVSHQRRIKRNYNKEEVQVDGNFPLKFSAMHYLGEKMPKD
jgi:hypothetical protein